MTVWVVPLFADEVKSKKSVHSRDVGPATADICAEAASVVHVTPFAKICLVTPTRKSDQLDGQERMYQHLVAHNGLSRNNIVMPDTTGYSFRTDGEMRILARFLVSLEKAREKETDIALSHNSVFLVARWFHLLRATAMLKKRLGQYKRIVRIEGFPVQSRDMMTLAREPFALAWNTLQGNVL